MARGLAISRICCPPGLRGRRYLTALAPSIRVPAFTMLQERVLYGRRPKQGKCRNSNRHHAAFVTPSYRRLCVAPASHAQDDLY